MRPIHPCVAQTRSGGPGNLPKRSLRREHPGYSDMCRRADTHRQRHPTVPNTEANAIGAASPANASGPVQTALSKLPGAPAASPPSSALPPGSSDRDLSFIGSNLIGFKEGTLFARPISSSELGTPGYRHTPTGSKTYAATPSASMRGRTAARYVRRADGRRRALSVGPISNRCRESRAEAFASPRQMAR